MTITIEIPDEHLSHTSGEDLKRMLVLEMDRILVRERFGEDLADAGVTMAEILENKKRAWDEVGHKYIKDLINPKN